MSACQYRRSEHLARAAAAGGVTIEAVGADYAYESEAAFCLRRRCSLTENENRALDPEQPAQLP